MIACCRCGGRTTVNQFGNGICSKGKMRRTCGFWWRRDGRCPWDWSSLEVDKKCPGACRWDHAVFFQPTITTPDGQEHRYHSPADTTHRVLMIARPHGSGHRMAEIKPGPKAAGTNRSIEARKDRRFEVMYSL